MGILNGVACDGCDRRYSWDTGNWSYEMYEVNRQDKEGDRVKARLFFCSRDCVAKWAITPELERRGQ